MKKWRLIAAGWLVFHLAGCGMSGSAVEISIEAGEASAPAVPGSGGSVSLPGGRSFNIHQKNSSQNPGGSGRSRGDSDATSDGQAFGLAEASDGGSASAEFKLGHRFISGSDKSLKAAIQIQFQLRQAIQAPAHPAPQSLATISLQILALDSHKRVLTRSSLVLASSDDTVGSATESHERNWSVTLEPQDSCDIILYGKVEASAARGQETSARLDIRQLKMAVDLQPATSQPAPTGDETQPAGR